MTTELMDLEEELPRRERRRLMTPAGVVAVGVAIAALGFFGGVQVQKSRGDNSAGTAGGAFAGGFAAAGAGGAGAQRGAGAQSAGAAGGGQGQTGTGGGQAGAGAAPGSGQAGAGGGQLAGATIGEVASVDGSTLYVDGSTGTTVKVKLAKGGTVARTAKAKASEIHPGDTVIVQGETASSGTVVASTIRATASNAGGALGGFGGAAPGATGAPGGG